MSLTDERIMDIANKHIKPCGVYLTESAIPMGEVREFARAIEDEVLRGHTEDSE